MPSLETRIAKLEAGAAGRVIAVELYEGETEAEALAHAGIDPGPRDLVVFLRKFSRSRNGRELWPEGLPSG